MSYALLSCLRCERLTDDLRKEASLGLKSIRDCHRRVTIEVKRLIDMHSRCIWLEHVVLTEVKLSCYKFWRNS